ncbi:MAG: Enoyl-(Acyl carrier protein) reductase [Rickettsiaceae bacterium]|jgi:NAD(P)-dependent dehydrogenase (short-subunit alcohol dehydrogenase family)|nr:Enoyl-(Acyl carrier protein) reductase [Rickettsiaceae bacterium]
MNHSNYKLNTPEMRKQMEDKIFQNFIAEPKELDSAILYLASNQASRYVTWTCLTVDGGVSWGG